MPGKTFQNLRRSGVAGTREFSGMAEPYHMVETVLHPYYFSSYTARYADEVGSDSASKTRSASSRRSRGMTVATMAIPIAPTTTAPA